MNPIHKFIVDSLKSEPIGETEHFVWFITDIGIAALFKKNEIFETYNLNVEKEAKNLKITVLWLNLKSLKFIDLKMN